MSLVDKTAFGVMYDLKGLASASASMLALVLGLVWELGLAWAFGVGVGVGVGVREGHWWPIDNPITVSTRHRAWSLISCFSLSGCECRAKGYGCSSEVDQVHKHVRLMDGTGFI